MADYKVSDTDLIDVADAIRAKTGRSADLEFPDEFVSEIGSISGGDRIFRWKASRTTFIGLQGIFDCDGIELDYNGFAGSLGSLNYFGFKDTADGTLVLKGIPSTATASQMRLGDFLRQAPVVKSVDFGGLAPDQMVRWCYQWNYSPSLTHSGTVTFTNLSLKNLSSTNSSFGAASTNWWYRILDIYWLDYLMNSMDLHTWNMLNADSWNRLIEHLYDYSQGDQHTLTVGSTILALIDAEHQALAASRGWTLA